MAKRRKRRSSFGAPTTAVRDVTEEEIRKSSEAAYGATNRKRVAEAAGARKLTPTLQAFFDEWKVRGGKTIGFISGALAYGAAMQGHAPARHKNLVRLIKGGHIRVCEVRATPPEDSLARRDSPYGTEKFFVLHPGSCPATIDPDDYRGERGRG
jgi:hypothetical protein